MQVLFGASPAAIVTRLAIGILAAGGIALAGYRLNALTRSGMFATIAVGMLSFAFGAAPVGFALVLFFASGSALSKLQNVSAMRARAIAAKHGNRDGMQVLANGAVATACAVVAGLIAAAGYDAHRWLAAAICAIAAASGDTWSTEIGSLLGRGARLVTSLRPVAAGTSGGITLIGTLAAPAGGAFVGLAGLLAPALPASMWITIGALAGLVGSLADSVAGATVQGTWKCPTCGQALETPRHEACGCDAALVGGWQWIDNDEINVLATLCGAGVGYVVASVTQLTA